MLDILFSYLQVWGPGASTLGLVLGDCWHETIVFLDPLLHSTPTQDSPLHLEYLSNGTSPGAKETHLCWYRVLP